MSTILSFLAGPGGVYAVLSGLIAAALLWARSDAKRDARKDGQLKAARERLEMDREATDAERKVGRMTDDEARKEALKWSRR